VNATFVYDGLGRREKKAINGNLTEFLFDRLNPVQETSGATVLANILPGLGIDEFLTRTDVISGLTSYFLTDALGSPIAGNGRRWCGADRLYVRAFRPHHGRRRTKQQLVPVHRAGE
jgi:hypothetical protein